MRHGNIFGNMRQEIFYYLYTTIYPVVNVRRELMEYSRQVEERGAYLNKIVDMNDENDHFEIKGSFPSSEQRKHEIHICRFKGNLRLGQQKLGLLSMRSQFFCKHCFVFLRFFLPNCK